MSTQTPAQRLDQIEQQADDDLQAIIATIVAAGITSSAVTAAAVPLIEAIRRAVDAGWVVGAQIILASMRRRTRPGPFTREALPTSVETDVAAVLADIAARITAAPDRADTELERARRRLRSLAITKIHQGASAGSFSYARWLGLDLEWVTRRDGRACPSCTAMHGRRAGAGERFPPPAGPGIPRRTWRGFQGLPPIHPNCRCRIVPART